VLLSSLRREGERIERAGGRAQMPLRKMQVNRRYFEVSMAEQDLNGAQVGASFEKVCGETMPQSVRVDVPVIETGAFSSDLASRP